MTMTRRSLFEGIAGLALCVGLVGCVTPPQRLSTPTGKPEVTIQGAKVEEVKNALTTVAMDWGYTVKSVTDYLAVYEKANTNALSNALLGSRYDGQTFYRLSYSLADVGNAVRVVSTIAVVTNPGSAFERLNDFSVGTQDAINVQSMLQSLQGRMETRGRGKVGLAIDERLVVVSVAPQSPAALAGVQVGDRLLAVDDIIVLDTRDATMKITGEPGTSVNLKVARNGGVQVVTVTRGQP